VNFMEYTSAVVMIFMLMASSIRGQSVYTNIENKLRGVFNNVRGSSVCWPIRYGWK
ncbi:unnamed protein product, partial [Allacma fusca]